VVATPGTCACCGKTRGHLYAGPVHAVEDPDGRLCPWCIADGSAAARYEAHFSGGVIGHGDVPRHVLLAIAERTPGFTGWQDSQWLVHCGDGAAFLGRAGAGELAAHPDALDHLRREVGSWGWAGHEVEAYLGSLDRDGQPTAYLFRCRVCGTHIAYSDFS
jgi:uncharacterized protein